MPKTVRFHEVGDASVLKLEELQKPQPGEGEVLLKVEAIGLNRAEVMFRSGKYIDTPSFPSLIGYEAAGVIEGAGPRVTGLKPGDRVSSIPAFPMTKYGSYGEYAVFPASAVAPYPQNLSPVEGASIWMQYITAYGVIEFGGLQKGQPLLVTAAASSVGLAAIQIAKLVGAISIATTRNQSKAKALADAGADFVINTETEDLVDRVQQITGGKGFALAFDPIAVPAWRRWQKRRPGKQPSSSTAPWILDQRPILCLPRFAKASLFARILSSKSPGIPNARLGRESL
jgi:NADPH:quinone reductase